MSIWPLSGTCFLAAICDLHKLSLSMLAADVFSRLQMVRPCHPFFDVQVEWCKTKRAVAFCLKTKICLHNRTHANKCLGTLAITWHQKYTDKYAAYIKCAGKAQLYTRFTWGLKVPSFLTGLHTLMLKFFCQDCNPYAVMRTFISGQPFSTMGKYENHTKILPQADLTVVVITIRMFMKPRSSGTTG